MQITVTIPDEIAVQAEAAGKTTEGYVQEWLNANLLPDPFAEKTLTAEELEEFFRNMSMGSEKIPLLPDDAFTRESIYSDHD